MGVQAARRKGVRVQARVLAMLRESFPELADSSNAQLVESVLVRYLISVGMARSLDGVEGED